MTSPDPEVHAIVGPTGSGKSELALQRARRDDRIEIVAVDAFTIYRGMDIGTAKPTRAERASVPHHLIDVLGADQPVTVSWFQAEARAVIADLFDRGRKPLLVGGSGLYFRAVVDDLRFPPTDREVRQRLETSWADRPQEAHEHLATIDPDAAAKIEPENLRRTVRALEVIELTGKAFSSFADAWDDYESIYPSLAVTYLEPDTATLRARIDQRARAMVDQGLLDEAERLRRAFPEGLSSTARQAIGYAEAFEVLEGAAPQEGLPEAIARRTWAYARRQRSWFRRDPRCHV